MNKTLRNILIAAVALVAVVFILPFVVPVGGYRDTIENAATRATGRTLRIDGPLRLMIFPQFGLRAERVTFANMPGGQASAMASIGDIRLAIRFLPLLTGHVEVARIILDHPVIALEVNAEGQANWQLSKPGAEEPGKSSVTLPMDTQFSGIQISEGRIAYDNAKTGTHRSVDHVNATIALTRLDQPVSIDGNLTEGDRRVDFDARIATVKSLLSNGTTALDLSLTSDMMQASFKGLMKSGGGLEGTLKFDTAYLRGVADWLGERLPEGGGLNGVSLESHIASKDNVTTLSPLRLSLDHQNMTGSLSLYARGEVPMVKGALSLDHLDLNPYLAVSAASPARAPAPTAATSWSNEPISVALLKKIDAQLTLSVGAVRLRGLRLGKTVMTVALTGGSLAARLDPITLYGGIGQAELDVDGRGAVPYVRNTLKFERVALKPLLTDALGISSIEGTGSLMLDVSAQGKSADAFMHDLSGKGAIAAGQGRIRGVDLGLVARTIQTFLGGDATGGAAATDFHDMGGSFTIMGGVLTNQDFHLSGPLVQMTGAGDIDIGNRAIDFHLAPKAGVKGASVGVPFIIKGSWDHVHYEPDVSGIMSGVMQNLESGRSPFKGLFGSSNKKGEPKKKKNIGDELKDLFGIH